MITRRHLLGTAAALGAAVPFATLGRPARAQPLRQFPGTTLSILSSSGHRQFNPVWDKIAEFEQATGIKVSLTRVPTGEIRQKIMQDLAMGAGQFDVLEILDDTIFSASQFLTSLEPFITQDYGSVEAWEAPLAPWARRVASVTGEVRGNVFYSGTVTGAYRESLFADPANQAGFKEKFGYDLPTPPKTWQELQDAATFFTREEGGQQLWGIVTPGKEDPTMDVFEFFVFNEGVPHLDEHNRSNWGEAHPENHAVVEAAAKYLQDLVYTHKIAPPTIPGMATNEAVDLYLNGGAAIWVDLQYFAWDEVDSDAVVERIGRTVSFELPAREGEGKGGIPFYWMWGISEASAVKEAAWEFVRWFTQEDNLKLTLTEGIGVYVPTDTALAQWAADQGRLPPAIVPTIAKAQFYQLNPQIGQVRQTVRRWVEQLWLNAVTPAEFREGSAREIDELLVGAGLVTE